jgi:SAM-dependent methyltransferase
VTLACRSCGGGQFAPVIDLGDTPLANALLSADALGRPEPRYPLRVVLCRGCGLVQITETVPPEVLFSDYVYFSSFSDTAVASAKALAGRLLGKLGLSASSLVIEAASNDGYLLQHYQARGIPVLGIEPAENVAKVANERGVRTRCAFFGRDEAARLRAEGLRCDVFHANNVLAHVADLNGFVAGIDAILKPDGIASIEVPYLRDLLDNVEFDTIYHEHLCYFSVGALAALFARHGLAVRDVERISIHGGSLRVVVGRAGAPPSPAVAALLESERDAGLADATIYADFAAKVARLKAELAGLLQRLKSEGRRIAAYGASAKGATLLNVFGIGGALIDFVVDRSTVKQGKFTPGTHLPILPPHTLLERRPDYVLLLTWNFADEILAQQGQYRSGGGRFIIPVPAVRIV